MPTVRRAGSNDKTTGDRPLSTHGEAGFIQRGYDNAHAALVNTHQVTINTREQIGHTLASNFNIPAGP